MLPGIAREGPENDPLSTLVLSTLVLSTLVLPLILDHQRPDLVAHWSGGHYTGRCVGQISAWF